MSSIITDFSPNGRKHDFDSFDYVDGKSAFRVATEELSSVTESSDAAQLVRDLVAQIETGRRKRKASETQSIGSSRRYFLTYCQSF